MIPAGVTRPSTAALIKYFLYLGSAGFGGPVALIGYMQRDLVERRGWFKVPEPVLIGAGAAAGLIIFALRA
jgi:hypothetical protein